jgi:hypothetical protein
VFILIPALVDSKESERLLNLTLEHIPPVGAATAVVVSQGRRPQLSRPGHLKDLIHWHSQRPLTKWLAISRARDALPQEETQVVLLDADDPVEPSSSTDALSRSSKHPAHCWIDRRQEIALFADDGLSPTQDSSSRCFRIRFS